MRLLIHDYAGHPFQVELSRDLAVRGHQVIHGFAGGLLTPRGELKRREGDPAGLEFVEFPMSPRYREKKYSFVHRHRFESQYGVGVARFIQEWRPDVVVSGNTPSVPQLAMAKSCREIGGRFVSWVQDFYGLAVDKLLRKKIPLLGRLAGSWYRRLDSGAFRLSAGVMVITDDFVPLVEQEGVPRDRILVLPNWAPLGEVSVRPRRNEWASRHGFADGFNFIYTGTLAMKHNPDLLLQLAKSYREDPAVRVMVVSEGPGAKWLEEQRQRHALANLHLLPFQPFSQMADVMGSADVLMAVLEPEAGVFSVPSKVLTYHCAGRPILAAIPSENLAAQIICRNGSGICVNPLRADEFVSAGRSLLSDAAARVEMGRRARAYAETHFDLKAIVPKVEEFLNCLVQRPV